MVNRLRNIRLHPKSWMFDQLTKQVGDFLEQLPDHRRSNVSYKLSDSLKGAYAMFSLKSPSLLAFRQNFELPSRRHNLQSVYDLADIPGDTAMRQAIDGVAPQQLYPLFSQLIEVLRQEQVWESRQVLGSYTAISVDGTGYYCSSKKQCPHCLVKKSRNGEEKYYHQLLGAVQMHPESKNVFPVGGEAIVRQQQGGKNDCEYTAAKRLISRVIEQFKQDKLLFVLDALYVKGPMIELIKSAQASYVIVLKQSYVQVQAERLAEQGQLESYSWSDGKTKSTARFKNSLILNGQYQHIRPNYVEFEQIEIKSGKTLYKGSWITDIPLRKDNITEVIAVGRSRWKIENETFNTLKNQGYHLEHNYGHGQQYLATNFALLTLIAFLVDQIAQALDAAFNKAWKACGSKRNLWEKVRQVFDLLPALSMSAIYRFITNKPMLDVPPLE